MFQVIAMLTWKLSLLAIELVFFSAGELNLGDLFGKSAKTRAESQTQFNV